MMEDRQIKVLLIEDNPGDARLIEEMLSEVDGTLFDMENVSRLSDGLTRIRKGGIDAVLLDLGLPDSAGLDTFGKVQDQAPEVPIVVLTGLDDTELALEGVRMGAQDYLVKGRADGDLLARTLRYAIERKTAEARIKHLNSVLKAVRNVNQLIVTETEGESLIRKSCDALVDARGYDAAWLGFLGDDRTFDMVVGSGFREDVSHFSDRVAGGDHPPCIRDALAEGEKVLVLDTSRECGDCFFKDACLGKEAVVIRVEHAGRLFGLLAVLLAHGVAVDEEEKELLAEVASDIGIALHNSEMEETRKKMEDALLESEKKYRILADNTVDCIWQMKLDFEFTYVNSPVLQLVGFTQEEWVGSPLSEHCSPEDMKFCLSLLEGLFKKDFEPNDVTFEMQLFHKNGETVDVEISSTVLFDDDGNPVGLQGATRNITERKQAEEERGRLLKELEAKNAEMERFAYTVSHDLMSPLTTVHGFANLLFKHLEKNEIEMAKNNLKYIERGINKMAQLLNDTLELSRIGRVANPSEDVSFGELASEALEQLTEQTKSCDVNILIGRDSPTVYVDRIKIVEVLVNLIGNSVNYMGEEPHPSIDIGYRTDDGETVFFVRDNGIGIDHTMHSKAFELFFKLDRHTKGTGAGLAIVKRIIEVHDGRVWIESEDGKGCTVCFTLPLTPDQAMK